MQTILYNISQVLGITIIHSLWQGMLVYIILRIIFTGASSLPAVKKYCLAIFAMGSVPVLFIYTLLTGANNYNWVNLTAAPASPLLTGFNLAVNGHLEPTFYEQLAGYMPYICAIYYIGLVANLLKLGWEFNKIRQIKRSIICAEQMQQFINSFSKKLDISKHIRLKFSELVDVPCMLGYFKPLILLPVSLSVHLSACEVEAILLHELSHIKRNDYLVNLLQQAISIMLFFNPFSWLINRIVNQERENSCDDLVIEKTGKPLIYARALLKLEEARAHDLQLALAVTGSKFYLLKRIERIMKTQQKMGNIRHLFIAILLFAGGVCSVAWLNPGVAAANPLKISKAPADSNGYIGVNDTVKHKSKTLVKNKPHTKKHYTSAKKTSQKTNAVFFENYPGMDSTFSDSIAKFYRGPEWKAQMEAMRKQGEEMKKQFNSPEWKNQMLAMQQQGAKMRKQFNSPEWKKQMEDVQKQGEKMRKQFDSPEWKKQMEDVQKQGEKMRKQFDSPEWKKQMEDIQKQGEKMRKQFDSPEWKKQMEDIQKQGEKMRKQFDSPEWKKQMEDIQKQGEKMRKQFDSPEWKKQMEDIQKQGEKMRKQFDGPEWKKMKDQKWMLKDTTAAVQIYTPQKDTVKN